MKASSPLNSVLSLLPHRLGTLFCALLLFLDSPCLANERSSKDELIQSIHQRVRDLNSRMQEMGASNLPPVEAPHAMRSLKEEYFFEEPEPKSPRLNNDRKKSVPSPKNKSIEPNTGFYFLPFGGLALVEDFDWPVSAGIASIESKEGHSLGASFGYRWKYFYLEERISYAEAQLERFLLAGTTTPVSGEISNLSFQQSIGLNFNFNEWSGLQIGVGGGLSKKELHMVFGPNLQQEDDWVFSYDGTVGIFFQPGGYFRCGINYRWLRSEGLERFSATDMHLIELALGLQF